METQLKSVLMHVLKELNGSSVEELTVIITIIALLQQLPLTNILRNVPLELSFKK